MKQGTGKSAAASGKVEPRSRGVNPGAVADIGIHQVRTRSVKLFEGRGIEAPKAACTTHPKGSQGKR